MKSIFGKIRDWNWKKIGTNILSATGEALVILSFSSASLILLGINYGLNTENVKFFDAFLTPFFSSLQPTEMIIYLTGLLSSTTGYFVFRIRTLKPYIVRMVIILLTTCVLLWISTPLFIAGLETTPKNPEFAATLAKGLGISALVLWWYSLYSQRSIFEKGIDFSGDRRGRDIAKKLEGFHNGNL